MNRLEIVTQLKDLEYRKQQFENLLNDTSDYYCKETQITAVLKTNAYDHYKKYDGVPLVVDKVIFAGYLKTEIEKLETQIQGLIENLIK